VAYRHVKSWRSRAKACLISAFGDSCGTCGYSVCSKALELHHLDEAAKDFTISAWLKASYDRLAREAAKCVLLCANCHREVHAGLRSISTTIRRFDRRLFDARLNALHADRQTKGNWRVDLALLRKQGRSWVHIAELVGVSVVRVRKVYRTKVGTTPRPQKICWPSDKALKKLIWVTPASLVAKSLGVSGSALKKRCKTRGVKTPPRGYWTKRTVSGAGRTHHPDKMAHAEFDSLTVH
jgi:hypothetical protein